MFVVATAASAATTISRKIMPTKILKSKMVNKLMPTFPTLFAMLFSIAIHPEELTTIPQILIWSLVAGITSAWAFKTYKTMFLEKINE